jgi:hypothetical protein
LSDYNGNLGLSQKEINQKGNWIMNFKVRDWVIYEGQPYQIALILGNVKSNDCLLIVPKGFKTAFQLNAGSIPAWKTLIKGFPGKKFEVIQAEELVHVGSVYYFWCTTDELSGPVLGITVEEIKIKKEIGL